MLRVAPRAAAVLRPNVGVLSAVQVPYATPNQKWAANILVAHASTGAVLHQPFYKQFRPKQRQAMEHPKDNPKSVPWHLIDAKGMIVGRLATEIAAKLRGKDKPLYTPNAQYQIGDHVVVINAKDVVFTGKKKVQKLYRWHTGHPGGLKSRSAAEMLRRQPEKVLYKAVYGMLPKNKTRENISKKLQIFPDAEYPKNLRLRTKKGARTIGYVVLEEPPVTHRFLPSDVDSSIAGHDDDDFDFWRTQAVDVKEKTWEEDSANFAEAE